MHVCARGGQKRATGSLELELQEDVVSYLMWVLGTVPESFVKTVNALNYEWSLHLLGQLINNTFGM